VTLAPSSSTIVQRVWNYWNVLRDNGMSYGDYVEQLTYVLAAEIVQDLQAALEQFAAIAEDLDTAVSCPP